MRYLLLAIFPLFLMGCKKKITQFYVDYTSQVVIQSSVGQAIPFSVITPEVETNSELEFEANSTRKDRVNSIYLKTLQLKITSPQNETFSFLNSVEIYISSPNVSEKKVAFKENIPANVGNTLVCDIVNLDLQDFIKEDRFTLRVRTVTDETIPQNVDVDVYSNFLVDAKLIKGK